MPRAGQASSEVLAAWRGPAPPRHPGVLRGDSAALRSRLRSDPVLQSFQKLSVSSPLPAPVRLDSVRAAPSPQPGGAAARVNTRTTGDAPAAVRLGLHREELRGIWGHGRGPSGV